jgi:hypothetical protein
MWPSSFWPPRLPLLVAELLRLARGLGASRDPAGGSPRWSMVERLLGRQRKTAPAPLRYFSQRKNGEFPKILSSFYCRRLASGVPGCLIPQRRLPAVLSDIAGPAVEAGSQSP